MSKFNFNPVDGFKDTKVFKNPSSEEETREQLAIPLVQIKNFINDKLLHFLKRLVSNDDSVKIVYNDKIDIKVNSFKEEASKEYVDTICDNIYQMIYGKKLRKPNIYLEIEKEVDKLSTPTIYLSEESGDITDANSAILGIGVLGRMVLGSTGGIDIPKLSTPNIYLEKDEFNKLSTPNIYLEIENDQRNKLSTPNIYLELEQYEEPEQPKLEKLSTPSIYFEYEEIEEIEKLGIPSIEIIDNVLSKTFEYSYTIDNGLNPLDLEDGLITPINATFTVENNTGNETQIILTGRAVGEELKIIGVLTLVDGVSTIELPNKEFVALAVVQSGFNIEKDEVLYNEHTLVLDYKIRKAFEKAPEIYMVDELSISGEVNNKESVVDGNIATFYNENVLMKAKELTLTQENNTGNGCDFTLYGLKNDKKSALIYEYLEDGTITSNVNSLSEYNGFSIEQEGCNYKDSNGDKYHKFSYEITYEAKRN